MTASELNQGDVTNFLMEFLIFCNLFICFVSKLFYGSLISHLRI